MAIEKFYIPISQEGSTGATRGKIPASMVTQMGADDGDVLVLEVNKRSVVGGHIATGREAERYRRDHIRTRGTSGGGNGRVAKKPTSKVAKPKHKVGKPTKSKVAVPKVKSKVKKSVKVNKRKTFVDYDEPRPKHKKLKLKLKKKGR